MPACRFENSKSWESNEYTYIYQEIGAEFILLNIIRILSIQCLTDGN